MELFQHRKVVWPLKKLEKSRRNKNVEATPAGRTLIQNFENLAVLFLEFFSQEIGNVTVIPVMITITDGDI